MKNEILKNPPPEGYSTVCPGLTVESIEKQMKFLQNVFDAKIKDVMKQPDDSIMHAELWIGDTVIMLGQASKEWPARISNNYVFVSNADVAYDRALKEGATSLMEPGDRFYGFREGGVTDPFGNQWWIAHQIESLTKKEMEMRFAEMQAKK